MSGKVALIGGTIALQYAAVILGVAWGRLAAGGHDYWDSWLLFLLDSWLDYWAAPGLASVVLLAWPLLGPNRRKVGIVVGALACYALLVMGIDPFVWVYDGTVLVGRVAVILPPLLCLKVLLRARAWPAVCGAVLFSATAIACLTFNVEANTHLVVMGFTPANRYAECR